ncbi:MAG: flagellar protein FlgN, partial [Clostridiaceae bacterium]|nr:flagellar protein FlgN [Clostridiaceae bacterium]
MSETLSSLLKLLEQEHEIYCDLLKSSDSKRMAIVEGNVDELDNIVSEEEKMIESINILEK